jgi:hypothetical protein
MAMALTFDAATSFGTVLAAVATGLSGKRNTRMGRPVQVSSDVTILWCPTHTVALKEKLPCVTRPTG